MKSPLARTWQSLAALAFLGLSLFTVGYALELKMYTPAGPGAGLFPLIIGISLGMASVLWLYQVRREPVGPADILSGAGILQAGLQLAAVVLFALLLRPLGYIASSFLLVTATAVIAGERNWSGILIVALLASFGLRAAFALLGSTL